MDCSRGVFESPVPGRNEWQVNGLWKKIKKKMTLAIIVVQAVLIMVFVP